MFTYNKYCMLSNLEILNEAKKIIDDNPVNISEEYLLDMLKVRFRWPKKSLEVISNLGNISEDFFDGRYNAIIFEKWYELYSRGFTTMLNNCLDIHPDLRKLENLLLNHIGEMPTGNIYMSIGTKTNRPSFDMHRHDYNVISKSIYGATTWKLGTDNQFGNNNLKVDCKQSVIIPKDTPHAVIENLEKRCSLTIILGWL